MLTRRLCLTAGCLLLFVLTTSIAMAQSTPVKKPMTGFNPSGKTVAPRDVKSPNFILHTDLAEEDAQELLQRLETMLKLISTYWGRPCRQVIECYVVKDLDNWPKGAIAPNGLTSIQNQAGVTQSTVRLLNGNPVSAKSTVYAIADRGTPQHEAVHAYCAQTFGRTGPLWYSEGMAEMGQYWRDGDGSVNCHPGVVKYLHETEPKTLNAIVNAKEVTGDSWENYAWRWALCHLLANNPNYAPRFRPLGVGLLMGQNVSFESVYGGMSKEISFEYLFFLQHFDLGYRADLCGWDWKAKFRPLTGTVAITSKIKAKGGWQPSLCKVKAGTTYEVTATGQWRISKAATEVDANGDSNGDGKLVGVLFNATEYELGKPFELGASATFTPETDGDLYLRCQQPWREINDEDSGQISLKIKRQ